MTINDKLKKPYWKRRININSAAPLMPPSNPRYYTPQECIDGERFWYLTNADLLNEIEPAAHDINSRFMSTRPIKQLVTEEYTDKNGNTKTRKKWKIVGYDDIETVRMGLQRRFAISKASHFAADGFWIANESDQRDYYNRLMNWKDVAGLDVAWLEIALSAFQSGDAAIYMYQMGSTITYKVFSYLYGDILYPQINENGEVVIYREYSISGRRAVDIYAPRSVETWVEVGNDEKTTSWLQRFKAWIDRSSTAYSDDGWQRIARKTTQVGNGLSQCIYFRINDIPSGVAQLDIEALERSSSFLAEEVKASAFPELFIKATKIENLPPIGSHGRVIAAKGNNVDELKAADAKHLTPPDASNIATIDFQNKMNSILHTTCSVFVEPEILKSGSDSSTTVQMLFYPEQQWCQAMFPQFAPGLHQIVEVLKALVANVEGDGGYITLKTSCGNNIWLPKNQAEKVDNTVKLVYAGILSKENARTELDMQYINDSEIINKEAEAKLYREAYIPTKAKAEAEAAYGVSNTADVTLPNDQQDGDPNIIDTGKPQLDKRLDNRNIAEEI